MIAPARFLFAVLLCILFNACREQKDNTAFQAPISSDSLISPEKMVLILADVHVVEAALLIERNKGTDSERNPDYYYQGVFKKYHISPARYDQNLTYYREDPENFIKMYEKVIILLESRQKNLSGKK